MAFYKSKFTGQEIDARLTQGTYDDAVKAGFKGTKEEFYALLGQLQETTDAAIISQPAESDKLETFNKNIVDAINELHQELQAKPDFATVAISGDYNDLTNTPNLTVYQTIADDSLTTSSKTIPEAINEIKTSVDSISDPYEINLTNLLVAEDSESISIAIGGIDNLNATVQDNRLIVGTISNGSVSVSIRILGNVTTLYYLLDSVVGLTLNEIAITNTSGTLSKSITTHSVLTENMVINSLNSDETTLPLSAAQGKVLATNKQDKTDKSLQTSDKTVAGAINEVNEKANDIADISRNLFSIEGKVTTSIKEANSVLIELYMPNVPAAEIKRIVISDCYLSGESYYNTIRIFKNDDSLIQIYSKTFSTLEECKEDSNRVVTDGENYAVLKNAINKQVALDNPKFSYDINKLSFSPIIENYIQNEEIKSLKPLTDNDVRDIVTDMSESIVYELDFDGYWVAKAVGDKPVKNASSGYKCNSEPIPVKPNQKFELTIKGGSGGSRAYAFIGADNRVVEIAEPGAVLQNQIITVPSNALYLICTNEGDSEPFVKRKSAITTEEWVEQELDNFKVIKSLKILCFGNSFTQGAFGYVPQILKNIDPDINLTIGIAFLGGCPLAQHLANFTNTPQIVNSIYTFEPKNYTYQKNVNNDWTEQTEVSVDTMLNDEDWDIVTFQQSSDSSYKDYDIYYRPFWSKLVYSLFTKLNGKTVKLGWVIIHGANADTPENFLQNWQGVIDNSKILIGESAVDVIFPYGTAVQNLRGTSIGNLGDGGSLTSDTSHLQAGIGCLAAAYSVVLTILDLLSSKSSILSENSRPDKEWIAQYGLGGSFGTSDSVIGITEKNCYLAQVAAIKASAKPYEVTDITDAENV